MAMAILRSVTSSVTSSVTAAMAFLWGHVSSMTMAMATTFMTGSSCCCWGRGRFFPRAEEAFQEY